MRSGRSGSPSLSRRRSQPSSSTGPTLRPSIGIGDRVERYFGAPAIGLEELPAVADAQAHRRPVLDVHPDCSAADAVRTVARRIERCEKRLTDRIGVH